MSSTESVAGKARLLTVAELAEVLSVPQSWVYARTANGEIPHVCVGRYKRFRLGEVMRWLESRSHGAA